MKIGYIGLGLMGAPCVKNLLNAGYETFIWARRPESMEPLVAEGAVPVSSKVELAKKVDILFTNVSNTSDVEEVLLGSGGVGESNKRGLIVVDMSTISATATRSMAAKLALQGIELVDAPVSGGTLGAQAGTLTIMVGSSEPVFEKIKPVLSVLGTTITRVGECGSGQVAKSCNQIITTGTLAAISEAFKFASSMGVDLTLVREALLGGFAGSRILEIHAMRMINNSYAPGFKAVLHKKDMGIVADIAKELHLALPVTKEATSLLEKTVNAGFGEEDSSAMYEIIKKLPPEA